MVTPSSTLFFLHPPPLWNASDGLLNQMRPFCSNLRNSSQSPEEIHRKYQWWWWRWWWRWWWWRWWWWWWWGSMREKDRQRRKCLMGQLLSTQPIHCMPKLLLHYNTLQCITIYHICIICYITMYKYTIQNVNRIVICIELNCVAFVADQRCDGIQWALAEIQAGQKTNADCHPHQSSSWLDKWSNTATITITFIIFADLQYQSPLIRRLMRPRPGTGVRTMPEIIKRDRMS